MNRDQPARTVILAAIEPSAASDQVTHTASALARLAPGAELHFVYVIDPAPPPHNLAISLTDLVAEGRVFLDQVVNAVAPTTTCRIAGHLITGVPAERIVQLAADIAADLLIVGTHGKRGLARILGSVSERVVRNAPCPVLLARVKQDADVKIEPPCAACVEVQRTTNGAKLWCDRHSSRHAHGHLHYDVPSTFGDGSMFVGPVE